MKIKSIKAGFAVAEAGRFRRTINVQLLPSLKIGEFVIAHAGFAIQKIDPEKAKESLRIIDEIPLESNGRKGFF